MTEQPRFWVMTSDCDYCGFETFEEAKAFAETSEEILAELRDNPSCFVDVMETGGDKVWSRPNPNLET
jgi:hypothetical protein